MAFRYESPLYRVLFDLVGNYKLGVQCSMLCSTVTDLPKPYSQLGPSLCGVFFDLLNIYKVICDRSLCGVFYDWLSTLIQC